MRKAQIVRKIIVYFLYILFVCCFQVSFPEIISFRGQVADLMFVFAVVVSYLFGFRDGFVVCLVTGLLRDYFCAPAVIGIDGKATVTVGIGMLVIFLAGFWGSVFFTKRINRSVFIVSGAVLTATLIYKVFGYLLIKTTGSLIYHSTYSVSFGAFFIDSILPQLLLNLITGLVLFFMLIFAGPYKQGINPKLIYEKGNEDTQWLTS